MSQKSIGLIETMGLCAGIAAADAAVKSANVTLLGYEYTKGDGMCTVKVEGNVGAVKAAVEAASAIADVVHATYSKRVIARPSDQIVGLLIENKENVGGKIALATGIRPKGQSAGPVLVKNYKPKKDKVEESAPVEETPIETPVEVEKEETPVEVVETPVVEEAPVEVVEEPVVEEIPEEPAIEETPEAVVEEVAVEEPQATEAIPETVAEAEPEALVETVEETVETAEEEGKAEEEPTEDAKEKTTERVTSTRRTSRGKRGGRKPKGDSPKK